MKKGLSGFLVMILLLLSLGTSCADPALTILDSAVRSVPWAEAYTRILQERAESIRAYEDYVGYVTDTTKCHPVGMKDLTGDGTPELIFLDLLTETEYGFKVGRLWIYTQDGSGVHCALSLQPEIDDLMYSSLWLGKDRTLTYYFSDTERSWTMQLRYSRSGHYEAETTLVEEADFSGEGPDYYYRNGKKISASKYRSEINRIKSDQGLMIGSLMVDDGYSGFEYTLDEALQELALTGSAPTTPPGGRSGSRFPELSFSLGEFTPGEKFAVYSAPSEKSLRAANGKAAITSGSEIFVAGTDGGWILILYELESGVIRVGYINPEKIYSSYTAGDVLSFARSPMTLVTGAEMTDDPIRQRSSLGKLKKGATVVCLAEYRGWIYVEAKVSGKTARGFITPSALGLETKENPGGALYGLAIQKLATRSGPGTQYEEKGTYSVKGQYIKVLARAWDSRNDTWWVKCEIPYKNEIRVLWTGYQRFDSATLPLDAIPVENW